MPLRLSARSLFGRSGRVQNGAAARTDSVCLFCSLSRPNSALPNVVSRPRRRWQPSSLRRPLGFGLSSLTRHSSNSVDSVRQELQSALLDLQKHAPDFVNLCRLQLALRNLSEKPGEESIRVAVVGFPSGPDDHKGGKVAKQLVRVALADPLRPEQEWEAKLEGQDASTPVILRVEGGEENAAWRNDEAATRFTKETALPALSFSTPMVRGIYLELLVVDGRPVDTLRVAGADARALGEAILTPVVETSNSNPAVGLEATRSTPIMGPVHKALLVADGIMGAASIMSLPAPLLQEPEIILAAANTQGSQTTVTGGQAKSFGPFLQVDTAAAEEGLQLFRDNVANAMRYEALWTKSNVAAVRAWLSRSNASSGTTKTAVRALIASLLRNTTEAVEAAKTARSSARLDARSLGVQNGAKESLDAALSDWAQGAHEELQTKLDAAFMDRSGRRERSEWTRRLTWWKLFWHVDDVGLLSTDLIAQRFLPEAERGLIYLAGRIRGTNGSGDGGTTYPSPQVMSSDTEILTSSQTQPSASALESTTQTDQKGLNRWPTHMAHTRSYILSQSIPALQALAQRLVIECVTTSAAFTSLSALLFLSGIGLYEASAAAALGTVWSLRRLQRRWEAGRRYWAGEVHEEGRKAIKASEEAVAVEMERRFGLQLAAMDGGMKEELTCVREMVRRAEDALARLN